MYSYFATLARVLGRNARGPEACGAGPCLGEGGALYRSNTRALGEDEGGDDRKTAQTHVKHACTSSTTVDSTV